MLILPRAVFLHVPKTGGTWVREAMRAAGVAFEEYLVEGDQHADLSYCPYPGRFKFAFVRHPLGLYSSYWRFKMGRFHPGSHWDLNNPFDVDCAAPSFDAFVEGVLARHPGWCTHMFEDYVGPPGSEIEFVGRFENLVADLVKVLRLTGTPFDEHVLRHTPPINSSQWPEQDARWSEALAKQVRVAERGAFERFGYT